MSYCAVGVYAGMTLLFRVRGWNSSLMLSMLSMFLEPIVPLQPQNNTQHERRDITVLMLPIRSIFSCIVVSSLAAFSLTAGQ